MLGGVLLLVCGTPALADGPSSAERPSPAEHLFGPLSDLPAVDGINGKMAIVTSVDDTDAKAIAGSLTIPMGHAFGLQIDGAVADLDLNFTDDVALYGVGVHAFWRDPSRALVGVYGHAVQLDVLGGVNIYTAGVESEFYLDRFTVESIIGFTDADFVEPAFHSRTQLAYYPTDNLKLSVGHTHNHNLHSF